MQSLLQRIVTEALEKHPESDLFILLSQLEDADSDWFLDELANQLALKYPRNSFWHNKAKSNFRFPYDE